MFSKSVDKEFKKKFYSNLQTNPQANILTLKERVNQEIKLAKVDQVKDFMKVIKEFIKDKIPAKPKFYALLLLKEIMDSKKTPIVEYFIKKLMDRLYKIAQFNQKSTDPNKGQNCLDNYFSQLSKENADFSQKFYTLLQECWKHWDDLYSSTFSKIKDKCDKLRPYFPVKYQYLNQIEIITDSQKFEKEIIKQSNPENQSSFINHSSNISRNKDPYVSSLVLTTNLNPSFKKSDTINSKNKLGVNTEAVNDDNQEKIRKCVEESITLRSNLPIFLLDASETNSAEILETIYTQIHDYEMRMEGFKETLPKYKNINEKLKTDFMKEFDTLHKIVVCFDEYFRQNITFEEFFKKVHQVNPQPSASLEDEEKFANGLLHENSDGEVEEKDFVENKRSEFSDLEMKQKPTAEFRTGYDKKSNPFSIEALNKSEMGNSKKESRVRFESNKKAENQSSKKNSKDLLSQSVSTYQSQQKQNNSRSTKQFQFDALPDKQNVEYQKEKDFDWEIQPELEKNPTGDFNTFVEADHIPFSRKTQSMSYKTAKGELKPSLYQTDKNKQTEQNFSPSTAYRQSNVNSKISEDPRDSHPVNNYDFNKKQDLQNLNKGHSFGRRKHESVESFNLNKSPFEIKGFENSAATPVDPFTFQNELDTNTRQSHDIFNTNDFRKKSETLNQKSDFVRTDSHVSLRKIDTNDINEINNSGQKSQKSAQNIYYFNDVELKKPSNKKETNFSKNYHTNLDSVSFKKKDFPQNEFLGDVPHQESGYINKFDNFADFGKAVDEVDQYEEANHGFTYNNQSGLYQKNEAKESLSIEAREQKKQFSKFKKLDPEFKNDNYEFDFRDSKLNENFKTFKQPTRSNYEIFRALQFNYRHVKNKSKHDRTLSAFDYDMDNTDDMQSNKRASQTINTPNDQSEKNKIVKNLDKRSPSNSKINQKKLFINDFRDPVDSYDLADKTPGKNISNSMSGYRMGFTFAGGFHRGEYEDSRSSKDNQEDAEQLEKNPAQTSIKEIKTNTLQTLNESKVQKFKELNEKSLDHEKITKKILDSSKINLNDIGKIEERENDISLRKVIKPENQQKDRTYELQIEDLRTQNEFYKQQCKLLFEQWSNLNKKNADEILNDQSLKEQVSQKKKHQSIKLSESKIGQKSSGSYPLNESNTINKKTLKQKKKIELYTKLNEQFSLYIDQLNMALGELTRS